MAHKVRYSDCAKELEDIEIRPLLNLTDNALRTELLGVVSGIFRYIEQRVTGDCNENLSYVSCHELFRLVGIFNSSRVGELDVTTTTIDEVSACLPALDANGFIESARVMVCAAQRRPPPSPARVLGHSPAASARRCARLMTSLLAGRGTLITTTTAQ